MEADKENMLLLSLANPDNLKPMSQKLEYNHSGKSPSSISKPKALGPKVIESHNQHQGEVSPKSSTKSFTGGSDKLSERHELSQNAPHISSISAFSGRFVDENDTCQSKGLKSETVLLTSSSLGVHGPEHCLSSSLSSLCSKGFSEEIPHPLPCDISQVRISSPATTTENGPDLGRSATVAAVPCHKADSKEGSEPSLTGMKRKSMYLEEEEKLVQARGGNQFFLASLENNNKKIGQVGKHFTYKRRHVMVKDLLDKKEDTIVKTNKFSERTEKMMNDKEHGFNCPVSTESALANQNLQTNITSQTKEAMTDCRKTASLAKPLFSESAQSKLCNIITSLSSERPVNVFPDQSSRGHVNEKTVLNNGQSLPILSSERPANISPDQSSRGHINGKFVLNNGKSLSSLSSERPAKRPANVSPDQAPRRHFNGKIVLNNGHSLPSLSSERPAKRTANVSPDQSPRRHINEKIVLNNDQSLPSLSSERRAKRTANVSPDQSPRRHISEKIVLNNGQSLPSLSSERPNNVSPDQLSRRHINERIVLNNGQSLPSRAGSSFPAQSHMSNSVPTLSSGGPSIPPSFVDKKKEGNSGFLTSKSEHKIPSRESEWGKFLALSTNETANLEKEDRVPYQQRYKELQAFLKKCDEPNGKYHQTIRNLSAAGRNGHAVQLEMRAIFLSLEEGKELQRMRNLNIFGKQLTSVINKNVTATPKGRRLPAPALNLVSGSYRS